MEKITRRKFGKIFLNFFTTVWIGKFWFKNKHTEEPKNKIKYKEAMFYKVL